MSLALNVPSAFSGASIQWFSDQVTLNGKGLNLTRPDLTIPAALLPQGGSFVVGAVISFNGQNGTATLSVPINSAPYCSSSGGVNACLAVTTKIDSFPNAEFVVTAVNFADNSGAANLRYEFGVMVNSQPVTQLKDRLTTLKFQSLPQGNTTLYVRAIDNEGASVLATSKVVVKPPAAGFSASSAVASIDVARAVATGDLAAINQAAMAITALAQYGFSNAANSSANSNAEFQKAVDAKATALLAASAANMDRNDPEAAWTAASTAASVIKVMTQVDRSTKKVLLDISKKVISAAKLAAKPVPSSTTNSVILLAKNGASASTTIDRGAAQRRSLLDDSTAEDAKASVENITSVLNDIIDMLAMDATPATPYLPAGDAGIFASALSLVARSLSQLQLQAGDTATAVDTLDPTNNAIISFAGPFMGPCLTTDDTGIETSQPCAAGIVKATAQYYEDASLFTDVRTTSGLPIIADTSGLAGISAASGAVIFSIDGQDPLTSTLPCAPQSACSIGLQLPLSAGLVLRPSSSSSAAAAAAAAATGKTSRRRLQEAIVNTSSSLVCLRMDPSSFEFDGYVPQQVNSTSAAADLYPVTIDASTLTGTCMTNRSGTYLLAVYTRAADNSTLDDTPLNDTIGYNFRCHFLGMDFDMLMANLTKITSFTLDVRKAVARAAALNTTNVQITNLTRGSVVASLTVYTPPTWTAEQVNTVATTMASNPSAVFDAAFMAMYPDITGVEVTVTSQLPPLPKSGLSQSAKIGIGVGAGVGGALLVGAVGVAVWQRRRRMAVEPRNELGASELA